MRFRAAMFCKKKSLCKIGVCTRRGERNLSTNKFDRMMLILVVGS